MSELNTVQNGKGSKPRITDKTAFDRNYQEIDWRRKQNTTNETSKHKSDRFKY